MKLEIKESYEGELSEEAQRVRDKASWALQTALKAAGVSSCCGGIEKALRAKGDGPIGEVQVIEDITKKLSQIYEDRLMQLRLDILRRVESLNEDNE